jgi:hypothetical protein
MPIDEVQAVQVGSLQVKPPADLVGEQGQLDGQVPH